MLSRLWLHIVLVGAVMPKYGETWVPVAGELSHRCRTLVDVTNETSVVIAVAAAAAVEPSPSELSRLLMRHAHRRCRESQVCCPALTGVALWCDCGVVDDSGDAGAGWMVVVSDENGAPGSWRWNVKRRRGASLETVAGSDQTYLKHADARRAAQAFMSAEQIWNRSDND